MQRDVCYSPSILDNWLRSEDCAASNSTGDVFLDELIDYNRLSNIIERYCEELY